MTDSITAAPETTPATMPIVSVRLFFSFFSRPDDDGVGAVAGFGSGFGPARLPRESFSLKISMPFKIASVYVLIAPSPIACRATEKFFFFIPSLPNIGTA
ncbi:hypothetical protein PanWU01x14_351900 [Parasponia andersonii]|uniref:Uncharacterized protein n=1 Tax=Parasponia andersonii TaxID=3476 RepID=A0A2P5AAJ1_PARAD|nr:hypothetical protein PanWU01x14_351900 [Parasponia andersonii]